MTTGKTEIMSCRSILCMNRRAHQGQVWNVILFNMSADKSRSRTVRFDNSKVWSFITTEEDWNILQVV